MLTTREILPKLSKLPIELIGAAHEFNIHADSKITATNFVMSFFLMISQNNCTLKDWAIELSKVVKRVFSRGIIQAKLQYRQVDFVKALLKEVLQKQVYQTSIEQLSSNLLSSFNRVLLEDSMCLKLPSNLSNFFPGAHSSKGAVATARIQARMDLVSGQTTHLEIQSFRDNDQKFGPHILHTLQAGDLVIRDLGYYRLAILRLINWMNAFFLSRYRFGTNVYDGLTQEQINLNALLKEAKKKGTQVLELQVFIGAQQMLPVRLVAIRVPQQVEQERRRKALKDRNQTHNHSKEYYENLAWTILITNVSSDVWSPKQMLQVYGFRWRIEIVFKAWKSHFNFERLFSSKQSLTPPRAMITLCLLLIWITLFFVSAFNFFLSKVYNTKQRFVSILKFAKFFKEHFEQLINCPDEDFFVELVAKHCVYDKRLKIPNFCQNLYLLIF